MNKLTIQNIQTILQNRTKDDKFTTLKDMPKPEQFKDIQKATKRIVEALKNDETINIVGDYDADGVTSTAIMVEFFNKAVGVEVNYIIPNRFEHGYGISADILELIYDGIIITVDNGISAIEAGKIAKERGLDLIITDHHTCSDILPDAYAIINPKQSDCPFPFSDICGANVAWYLCANIKKELGLEFNLMELFDLLTIAVVADIMPMVSLNKTIVKRGLKELSNSKRPAILALKKRYGLVNITEEDIGFKIAPLINCAGRMEDASIALEFLLSYDIYEANENLDYLVELNERRKKEQLSIFEDAKIQVDENSDVIVVSSEDWNEGIIGIVASKLCDKYKKPSFVFKINDNIAKCSARSVADINLYDLITKVKDLTLGYGGHKGAAGLSCETLKLEDFKEAINIEYKNIPKEQLELKSQAIGELALKDITAKVYSLIDSFRPFGMDNSLPVFEFRDLEILSLTLMGKNKEYKKLVVGDGVSTVEVVIFQDIDTLYVGDKVSFIATIGESNFRGISYNLMLKELLLV
jgi:single-stranded-DNA-specific exonuclease